MRRVFAQIAWIAIQAAIVIGVVAFNEGLPPDEHVHRGAAFLDGLILAFVVTFAATRGYDLTRWLARQGLSKLAGTWRWACRKAIGQRHRGIERRHRGQFDDTPLIERSRNKTIK